MRLDSFHIPGEVRRSGEQRANCREDLVNPSGRSEPGAVSRGWWKYAKHGPPDPRKDGTSVPKSGPRSNSRDGQPATNPSLQLGVVQASPTGGHEFFGVAGEVLTNVRRKGAV